MFSHCLCLFLVYCVQAINKNANVAVIEYAPVRNFSNDSENTRLNFFQYENIITKLRSHNVDLVVFPEATLNNKRTACKISVGKTCYEEPICPDKLLTGLASTVNSSSTYTIINLTEKEKCKKTDNDNKNCREFGFRYYNTDVVFDRSGKIITKYRKYHLFAEYDMDEPKKPDQIIIKTDFGLKLGMFTCFDILFKSPAQDLVPHVDGAVFPSMWFSQLPFLTSLQTQQMWAHAHNVKFFAAGANNPAVGSGGTGIYDGSKGTVSNGIISQGGTKIFFSHDKQKNESIDELGKSMDHFKLLTDQSVFEYESEVLEVSTVVEKRLCYQNGPENTICCDFKLRLKDREAKPNKNVYTYHLVAYSGVRSFKGAYNGGIDVCGLIACLNSSLLSCGHRFHNYEDIDWPLTFEEIQITAKFEKSENKTQYPNSLLSSIRPIEVRETSWESNEVGGHLIERKFSIKKKQDRLLTFAIFGRKFQQDSPANHHSNTGVPNLVNWVLFDLFNYLF